jgi:unsaturated rhamnogalacturonyl hydrolase
VKKLKLVLTIVTLVVCGDSDFLAMPMPETVLPSKAAVLKVINLVNTHWLNGHVGTGSNNWDDSVYHLGNLAAYDATNNLTYLNYTTAHAIRFNWLINQGIFTTNADRQALGQVYLGLTTDRSKLADIVTQTNTFVVQNDFAEWTWVDALFMDMPVFAKLGSLYGDANYSLQLSRLFNYTQLTLGLYDTVVPVSHLWYRDSRYKYPKATSPSGKKVLWSRGNGWVFAALAATLSLLPKADPNYLSYQTVFTAMAASLLSRQRTDGFWNSNLDDPANFGGPETSGTAAFTYGMASGIQLGLLDRATYLPAVARAWSGLVNLAVQVDGFLGYVQPVGAAPAATNANTTANFGVGLFLLAGGQVAKLAPSD